MMEEPWKQLDAASLFGYMLVDCCTHYVHVLHTNRVRGALHRDVLRF